MSGLYPWDKSITGDVLAALFGPYCGYCDAVLCITADIEGTAWTIDHMTPRSKGGTDDLENLTLACTACNSKKRAKSVTEFVRLRYRPDVSTTGVAIDRNSPLVAIGDIAKRLEVTSGAVTNWIAKFGSFPRPAKYFTAGGVWLWPDVEAWAIANGRLTAPLAEGGQPVRLKGGRPRIHPVQS